MKTTRILALLALAFGLLTQALIAQAGPAGRRGPMNPDATPVGNPDDCLYYIAGECPGCQLGSPEDCPFALDGTCPNQPSGPAAGRGPNVNPSGEPKQDGTGGPGKPANPAGPQDGSAPGYRGGRG